MKNFKLYAYIGSEKVLVTDSANITITSTYEETLSIAEHGQCSFECKIIEKINNATEKNRFYDLFYPQGLLYIELYDYDWNLEQGIKLVIQSVTPTFYKENTEISISAVDYASERLSKRGANLEYEATGNIYELAGGILSETKTNPAYLNIDKNYFSSYNILGIQRDSTYTDVLSCEWTDYGLKVDLSDYEIGVYDNFKFKILRDLPNEQRIQFGFYIPQETDGSKLIELSNNIYVEQYNINNQKISTTEEISQTTNILTQFYINLNEATTSLIIKVPIVRVAMKSTTPPEPIDSVCLKEFSIKAPLNYINNDLWKINVSLEDFKNSQNNITYSTSYYKKSTLSLSGSNLYNGLIEICNLFNAYLEFNYDEKIINFISKDNCKYKGYKLNPEVNLNSFSRKMTSDETYTIVNIYGGEIDDIKVDLIPTIPNGLKYYLWDCIKNDFVNYNDKDWFQSYTDNGYTNIINYILRIFPNDYLTEEQFDNNAKELYDAASVLDMAPNFENKIYNIDYFYNTGKISTSKYNRFKNIINNDLRKINIKLRLYGEEYYKLYARVSGLLSEIVFLSQNIVSEEKYLNKIYIKLDDLLEIIQDDTEITETERLQYKEKETKYRDMIASTLSQINLYIEQLQQSYGLIVTQNEGVETYNINLSTDKLAYCILQLYGYSNAAKNCFITLLSELEDDISTKQNNLNTYTERITEINTQLLTVTSEYIKTNLETEKAGLESAILNIENALGRESIEQYDSHDGYLIIRKDILTKLMNAYNAIPETATFTKTIYGYDDLLNNYNSNVNLNREKDNLLATLYSEYEPYLIEGYYENEDETDSMDLAEQFYSIKDQFFYPKITYDVGVIDLSSLEDYKFLKIHVGDKIKIDSNNLFLEYNPNYQDFLIINSIKYNLRKPEDTTLVVDKQDLDTRLMQKLFIQLNSKY